MTDELRQRTAFTPTQEKKVKALKQAIREAKRAGVGFHFILDTLYAFNGRKVDKVVTDVDQDIDLTAGEFNDIDHTEVATLCSAMADDNHLVVLKDTK